MTPAHAAHALSAIITRELLRFVHQRERFVAALVRPLIWLFVFAAGFRAALGVSIIPPYQTYVPYETYVVPGLAGMILLFAGMQSSLSMVYDREMGSMRVLLTSPLPRWYALFCKLLAGTLVAVLQVLAFLIIARLYGIRFPWIGFITVLPALFLGGMALGAVGLFLSSLIKQLENFAGVMNFVIFPAFFLSSALYPLWKMRESSTLLWWICTLNPFTYVVELIRFALYQKLSGLGLIVTAATFVCFAVLAIVSYDPKSALVKRQVA
jgi:ABC-2 type transport system permease protein